MEGSRKKSWGTHVSGSFSEEQACSHICMILSFQAQVTDSSHVFLSSGVVTDPVVLHCPLWDPYTLPTHL